MKKLFFLSILLSAFVGDRAFGESTAVGVILPLTGAYANFGEAAQNGLKMAFEEAGSEKIRLIFEDSQYDGARTLSAFNKLTTMDHVSAIIVLGSGPASAIVPMAETRNIPIFAWTPSKKITAGKKQVVRLMTSASEQGEKMAGEVTKRGYKKIAFFAVQNEYAQSVKEGFFSSNDPALVAIKEDFDPKEQDFRANLTRARAAGIDSIGLCLGTDQVPGFLKQAKEIGLDLPIFGCHTLSAQAVLSALTANNFSAWFVEGLVDSKFEEAFQKTAPDSSGIWCAAVFHDLGELILSESASSNLIAAVTGKPVTDSALKGAKIVRGSDDTYFDVPLGITHMSGGRFIR